MKRVDIKEVPMMTHNKSHGYSNIVKGVNEVWLPHRFMEHWDKFLFTWNDLLWQYYKHSRDSIRQKQKDMNKKIIISIIGCLMVVVSVFAGEYMGAVGWASATYLWFTKKD